MCGTSPALSKTPGCPGAVVRLDRVRHRDHPVAPATTVAALVDPPTRLLRSAFLQAWNDGPGRHRVHPVQRHTRCRFGCRPLQQNGTDWDRSWRSPCSCLIRSSWSSRPGRRQRSRWTPVPRRGRALPVTPRSRHPLRGRRRSRRLRRRLSPTGRRFGTASGRSCTVTDLVRSFTGGFTEPSMKPPPAVRTPRGLPQARRRPTAPQPRNTHLRPHPRMRPDHDCYEDVPPTGTPLDGDWFT